MTYTATVYENDDEFSAGVEDEEENPIVVIPRQYTSGKDAESLVLLLADFMNQVQKWTT